MYRVTDYAMSRTMPASTWWRALRGKADTLEEENTRAWIYIEWYVCRLALLTTSNIVVAFTNMQAHETIPRLQRANAYAIRRPQQVLDRVEERGLIERIRGGVMPSRHI